MKLSYALILITFLMIEKNVKHPMLPLHLFDSPTFNVLLLLGAVLNGAGLAFLPLTVGFVISNLLSGRIINRYGIKRPILIGVIMSIEENSQPKIITNPLLLFIIYPRSKGSNVNGH